MIINKVEVTNTFVHFLPCVTLKVSYDFEIRFIYGPLPFISIHPGEIASIVSNLDLIS